MKRALGACNVCLQQDLAGNVRMRDAFGRLLHDVLGVEVEPASLGDRWRSLAFFTPDGLCVSGLEIGRLPLVLDDEECGAAGIRSVATHPDWRRRGLFRRLMDAALEACEADSKTLIVLYTETPSLYESFGFRQMPQHAFAGSVTASPGRSKIRRLDLADAEDRQLVYKMVDRRTPVSSRCALLVDAPLFIGNVAKNDRLILLYEPVNDAFIVYKKDGDQIVIADIVAARMPAFETLMRMVPPKTARITCLFPPDKLGWKGTPIEIDTGLMVRGSIPPAMKRPFMFPPTSEF